MSFLVDASPDVSRSVSNLIGGTSEFAIGQPF